jgi:hypothetical protein
MEVASWEAAFFEKQNSFMQIQIEKYSTLPQEFRKQLNDMTYAEFGHIPAVMETVWAKPNYTALFYIENKLVTFYHLLSRFVKFDDKTTHVVIVQNVITPPQYRAHHYATLALKEGENFIFDTIKAQYSLLLCGEDRIPFYERLSWETIPCPVYYQQPDDKKRLWQATAMLLQPPFEVDYTVEGQNPDAFGKGFIMPSKIDLCGLPF